MAQQIPEKNSTAGAYEDQKNNGNRKTEDQNIGGAEKGGPGLSRAQTRMPPDAEQQENHDSPVEGSRADVQIPEDHSH